MVGTVKATLAPACPFKILLFSKAEKVSFKHDHHEALDRKKSIFDIMDFVSAENNTSPGKYQATLSKTTTRFE